MRFSHIGLFLQLAPCVSLSLGAFWGCTSGVTEDDTRTSMASNPDAGEPADRSDASADASAVDTASEQQSSATRPTSTSTNGSVSAGTQPASSEVNSSESETSDSSSDDGTSGSSTATSSDNTTSGDTSQPIPGGQDVFIAFGHGQRTIVSCDDGQTWSHNRFTDDIPLSGTDTDHIPFSMRATAYDDGAFYVAWGWGAPSYVERSTDGVNWEGIYGIANEDERSGNDWVWGLAAGGGKVVMGENRKFFYSPDKGENWEVGDPGVVAQKVIFGYGDGVFVAIAEGQDQGGPEFLRSTDGLGWSNDVDVPEGCIGGRVTSIPFADGTFLFAAGSHYCRSTDGGQSWQYSAAASGKVQASVYDGSRFISMTDNGSLFASTDAVDWEPIGRLEGSGGGMAFGASKTTGTLVGVRGGVFYRSDNGGASFEELPGSAYIAEGGPITQIEFGRVASSDACP